MVLKCKPSDVGKELYKESINYIHKKEHGKSNGEVIKVHDKLSPIVPTLWVKLSHGVIIIYEARTKHSMHHVLLCIQF